MRDGASGLGRRYGDVWPEPLSSPSAGSCRLGTKGAGFPCERDVAPRMSHPPGSHQDLSHWMPSGATTVNSARHPLQHVALVPSHVEPDGAGMSQESMRRCQGAETVVEQTSAQFLLCASRQSVELRSEVAAADHAVRVFPGRAFTEALCPSGRMRRERPSVQDPPAVWSAARPHHTAAEWGGWLWISPIGLSDEACRQHLRCS